MVSERLEEAERLLIKAREALRLTREYVGEGLLPNIEGWSHYDATIAIDVFLAPEPVAVEVNGT
jgi:hypothetical protein